MNTFDPERYLERIEHHQSVRLSEEGLALLHRQQLFTIPFENFDVLLGRPILLDPASLSAKLIDKPRGGYCFELNGLFLEALRAFGFEAQPLLARVHVSGRPMGRSHQVSLVTINGKEWLTDVGFGSFNMRAPIPFACDRLNHCDGQTLRLARTQPYGIMLQYQEGEGWKDLYSLDREYVGPGDIIYGNYYTSTHPDSIFTNNRMASLATCEGRVSLLNQTLRVIKHGEEQLSNLPDDDRYLASLRTHFGIELDAPYDQLPAPAS